MPPTGGPTGVPGCCTCVAAPAYTARIVTNGCNGQPQAGNTVTLRNRPAGTTVLGTATTNAQGQADFALAQSQQFFADVSTPEYAATQTGAAPFVAGTVSTLTVNHPQCNWTATWPTTLSLTDPWGGLTATKGTSSGTWDTYRMRPLGSSGNCNGIDFTNSTIKVSYSLSCLSSPTGSSLQLSVQYPACRSLVTGAGIPEQPVPAEDSNGIPIDPWRFGVSYSYIVINSARSICGINTRNPPDLTFTNVNFSNLGGSANDQVTVTV